MPSDETISYVYDAAGRVSQINGPGKTRENFKYGPAGDLIEKEDQWGNTVRYEYNELGQAIKEHRSGGLVRNYRYDKEGNLAGSDDNAGAHREYLYDVFGQATKVMDGPVTVAEYNYDPLGNLLAVTGPLGKTKEFSYGSDGALIFVREPNGDEARYEYDLAGRLVTVLRPGGGTALFKYDAAGNLVSEKDPFGNEQSYRYDPAGRLTKKTKASGQSVTMSYDRDGRLAEEKFPDGRRIKYTYDRQGKRTDAGDDKYSMGYKYDKDGRVSAVEYAAIKKAIKYEFNKEGLRSRLVMSDGKDVRYEYDDMKRLSAIVLPDGRKVSFSYDLKGRRNSIAYPNGVSGVFEYDPEGRIAFVKYGTDETRTIFSERYTYNAEGNVIEREDNSGRIVRYRYDPSGQLLEEAGPEGSVQYSYGPGGNRAEVKRGADTIKYTYDKADRMVEAGNDTLRYDSDGNLISRKGGGARSYAYDAENRLVKAVDPASGEVFYGYDRSGARVWKRDSKGITYFLYDGLDLVQELEGKLDMSATYVYAPGIDSPVAMLREGRTYFYHADRLGSIRHLTDDQRTIAASYDYDAFGKIIKQDPRIQNPFTYTGRELDNATGLYYYRARYYDPDLGRFLSPDPELPLKTEPIDLNPYPYVKNNPVGYKDPLGLAELYFLGGETPAQALFRAEFFYRENMRLAANPDGWAPDVAAELAAKFQQEAAMIRSKYPGIVPDSSPPISGPAPRPPGESVGTSVSGSGHAETLAVRPGGAKNPNTVAVNPGGAKGPNAVAVGPGESVSPVPESASPPGSKIKNGIKGAGVGAIFSGIDYYSCIKEGKSHAECLKEFGTGLVTGVAIGAAVGVAVTATGTLAPVAAGGALVIGIAQTGVRLGSALTSTDAQQTTLSEDRIKAILANLDAKIGELEKFAEMKDLKKAVRESADNAEKAAKALADDFKKVNKMGDDIQRKCNGISARIVKAGECASKAKEAAAKATKGLNDAISVLAVCAGGAPVATADGLQQSAMASKTSADSYLQSKDCGTDGLKNDLTALKPEFRQVRDEINKARGLKEVLEKLISGGKISAFDVGFDSYSVNAANFATAFEVVKQGKDTAEKLNEEVKRQKVGLLNTVANLGNVFPSQYADKLENRKNRIERIGPREGLIGEITQAIMSYETMADTALSSALNMLPSLAGLAFTGMSLTSCGFLSSDGVDRELQSAAQALAGLDALGQRASGLRANCVAKLNPKPPQKPTAPTQAQLTNVVVSPSRVVCEEGDTCPPFTAMAIYSDGSQTDVTVSATWWPPQPIRAVSQSTFSVKATYSGKSGTGQVEITPKQKSGGGPELVASGLSPTKKTVTKGGKATGFVITFGYIDYGKPGLSGTFDRTVTASCSDIPDKPGTYTISCSGVDPVFSRGYQESAVVTVTGDSGDNCSPSSPNYWKCAPLANNKPKNPVPTNIGDAFNANTGSQTTSSGGGTGQPMTQPQSYTTSNNPLSQGGHLRRPSPAYRKTRHYRKVSQGLRASLRGLSPRPVKAGEARSRSRRMMGTRHFLLIILSQAMAV